jgi:hypothetical protein
VQSHLSTRCHEEGEHIQYASWHQPMRMTRCCNVRLQQIMQASSLAIPIVAAAKTVLWRPPEAPAADGEPTLSSGRHGQTRHHALYKNETRDKVRVQTTRRVEIICLALPIADTAVQCCIAGYAHLADGCRGAELGCAAMRYEIGRLVWPPRPRAVLRRIETQRYPVWRAAYLNRKRHGIGSGGALAPIRHWNGECSDTTTIARSGATITLSKCQQQTWVLRLMKSGTMCRGGRETQTKSSPIPLSRRRSLVSRV